MFLPIQAGPLLPPVWGVQAWELVGARVPQPNELLTIQEVRGGSRRDGLGDLLGAEPLLLR